MSLESFLAKVGAAIANFISGAPKAIGTVVVDIEKAAEVAANVALNLVNGFKTFVESPEGQAIEKIVESVVPAQWVNAILDFLPTIIQDLGWAKAEFTKSPAQVVQDGINAAVNAANPDVKATNLNTLYAHIKTKVASLQGVDLPVQASLAEAHVVYSGLDGQEAVVNAEPVPNA